MSKPNRNTNYNPELEVIDLQENLEVACDQNSNEFDSSHFSFND